MDYYLALICLWLVLGNAWHGILLAQHKSGKHPPTISEHAAQSQQLLMIHRFVHSVPLVLFLPAIFGFLLPRGYTLAAGLLMTAAVFDSIETCTLNKKTATLDSWLNAHFITAWSMAFCYFAYALVISRIAGLSAWVYLPLLLLCLLLVVLAKQGVSKNVSLIMQMAYFITLSSVGILANIKLIIS